MDMNPCFKRLPKKVGLMEFMLGNGILIRTIKTKRILLIILRQKN